MLEVLSEAYLAASLVAATAGLLGLTAAGLVIAARWVRS